ncbi:MAG: hypothetical protein JNL57_10995 [Bacteroidetes bacterium]|nr:hypothetical protein [Bacteroidota bacterium]
MAIWPFLFTRYDKSTLSESILNHEKIHFRQQLEMLWIGFFLWYSVEFVLLYLKLRNRDMAYRQISFEREAYGHESHKDYLKHRKWFAWSRYLRQ